MPRELDQTEKPPIERKVTTATTAALVTAFLMTYIIRAVPALSSMSDILEAILTACVTAAITYVVAFWTKHTARNDVGTRRTGTSDPIPPTG